MIVTCPSCRTRFRLATEKVGPDGARIRCSRCGAVFAARAAPPPLPRRTQPAAEAGGVPSDPFEPAAPSGMALGTPPPVPQPDPLGWGEVGLDLGEAGAGLDVGTARAATPVPTSAPPELAPAPPRPASTPAPLQEPNAPRPAAGLAGAPGSRGARGTRPGRRFSWLAPAASLVLLLVFAASLVAAWRAGGRGGHPSFLGGAAAGRPVQARGVRGGLYAARDGARALVVRGEVVARAPVEGPVRVRVELSLEGATVASGDALAGATASAEEVWSAASPAEALALRRALDARAAPRLGGGAAAPFLVLFVPPPEAALRGELALQATADPVPPAP
jgi:predicted Zn finger-like uncharacterized protein